MGNILIQKTTRFWIPKIISPFFPKLSKVVKKYEISEPDLNSQSSSNNPPSKTQDLKIAIYENDLVLLDECDDDLDDNFLQINPQSISPIISSINYTQLNYDNKNLDELEVEMQMADCDMGCDDDEDIEASLALEGELDAYETGAIDYGEVDDGGYDDSLEDEIAGQEMANVCIDELEWKISRFLAKIFPKIQKITKMKTSNPRV